MKTHPVERAILDEIHAQSEKFGAAGLALIALAQRHQPVMIDGRLKCDQCWLAGFGQSPYPCGDLRTICQELGIDLHEELEAIARQNADYAIEEKR